MKVPGYDYQAFMAGIAERDGTNCWVHRLLAARRAATIERWRTEGSDCAPDRCAGWVPGGLLRCDGVLDGHHLGLSKQWLKSWHATQTRAVGPIDLYGEPVEDQDFALANLLNDSRNGVLACRRHHDMLEHAVIVVRRADLPESVEGFAAELGTKAVARLERDYGPRSTVDA